MFSINILISIGNQTAGGFSDNAKDAESKRVGSLKSISRGKF
jgi:hypothetical protein